MVVVTLFSPPKLRHYFVSNQILNRIYKIDEPYCFVLIKLVSTFIILRCQFYKQKYIVTLKLNCRWRTNCIVNNERIFQNILTKNWKSQTRKFIISAMHTSVNVNICLWCIFKLVHSSKTMATNKTHDAVDFVWLTEFW